MDRVKVLVTGGAGFIGSHLVERLLELGHEVRVVDDFSTGKEENLAPFAGRIELLRGSLVDPGVAGRAVSGVEWVFHQAALPSVPRSLTDPVGTHRANAFATMVLLHAAADAGVGRLVYAASSSAYGDAPGLPRTESMSPRPCSPYAVAKVTGELYAFSYREARRLASVCLRYFNVFGPGQDPASQYAAVVPRFIRAALQGERPVVFGDGTQSRDFTYVSNVVDANLLAAESERAVGEVINVGTGTRSTVLELLEALARITGKELDPEFALPREGDVMHSLADITKARELLGYEPRIGFQEGLERTVDWYRTV